MSSLRSITSHPTLSLVETCQTLQQIQQVHTQVLVNGLLHSHVFLGKFVATVAFSHPQGLHYSNQILNQYQNQSILILNTLIRAYARSSCPQNCFHYYSQILWSADLFPDNYTFTFLVRACAHVSTCGAGPASHAAAVRWGFDTDQHVQSGLIHVYAQLGVLDMVRRVYMGINNPDLVTQTAVVSAFMGAGDTAFAQKLFDGMPERDLISWNAIIAGYSQQGRPREALKLFSLMQGEGVEADEATLVSVLSACAQLGALDKGKWVDSYIRRKKLPLTVTVGTALVDMYSKCGEANKAMQVFWRMKDKNVYTWSSMMGGLAMHGGGKKCLELFDLMKKERVLPNEVTLVSVLRGCSVAGLIEEGKAHFDSMTKLYGLQPTYEHYGCMVDMYGRAGLLDDAIDVINNMPVKPHVGAWVSLLNACRIHKEIKLAELAFDKIIELEPKNDGAYVLLSNIYADLRNWKNVTCVRQQMKAAGVRKEPGCSVIEVGGDVHEFFVGDKSHPRYKEIDIMLGEVSVRLAIAGYVAETSDVLFDVEEEEKENALSGHTEKVAIAFGMVTLKEGETIRVVMNLRVCGDCHATAKMISRVFNREILLRDRSRFHHFKAGECSCMDFW